MSETSEPRTSLARARTELAYGRSRWAAERTLMAWIRTSIALVTFGFAVDRFVAYLRADSDAGFWDDSQTWFGFALVSVGILLLTLAIVEHLIILGRIKRREFVGNRRLSLALVGASLVLMIGVLAMVTIVMGTRH